MGAVSPNLLAFSVLAALAVLAAIGVVFSQNAIRSALCLVGTFVILAVLYFTLGAPTLGIFQVVVYTGAIMVLFLFVIMLLTHGSLEAVFEKREGKRLAAGVTALALAVIVGVQAFLPLAAIKAPPPPVQVTTAVGPHDVGSPQVLGENLFTAYGYPFEATSLLLMIGIVGSVMLAKRRLR